MSAFDGAGFDWQTQRQAPVDARDSPTRAQVRPGPRVARQGSQAQPQDMPWVGWVGGVRRRSYPVRAWTSIVRSKRQEPY